MAYNITFQADSDQLLEIAKEFDQEADRIQQVLNEIRRIAEEMRGDGWIGLGADKFFELYDNQVVRGLENSIRFMENSADNARALAKTIDDQVDYILSKARV